jgi:dihydrofolate reductase
MLNLIFCVDNSGLFGRDNEMVWNFKEELKYFKDITTNFNRINNLENLIVMGYNTWDSIKKKLPNRVNVVISSNYKNKKDSLNKDTPDYVFKSFDQFMENCKKNHIFYDRNIFIIGGKKLLSYVIVKYNKFIKHVFISIIQHSFPQFINDTVLRIYSFNNFEINKLSYNSVYCLNTCDNKYYHINFNQYLNKNFNINEILKFTDTGSNSLKNNINDKLNTHEHTHYTILEEMNDVTLNYCDDCESIVKNKNSKICNNCISRKCKCLFC